MASPVKSLSARKFFPMLGNRQSRFEKGEANVPESTDGARSIALALHPERQYLKVSEVTERASDCKSFKLVPDTEKGTEKLAYFGAGKYLTVFETVGGIPISRAYSISSSPKNSLEGFYELTIKRVDGGLMSNYILSNWQVGTSVEVSAPSGNFEYQPLRDAGTVICLAGGSGITPFISMANAVDDGDEDFNLVLLYGSRNPENEIFSKELKALDSKCNKIKVVHVFSDVNDSILPEGCEKGFITAELIKKYAPANDKFSIFICGPQQMYNFLDGEIAKLNIEKKYVRREMFGEVHNPSAMAGYPSNVPETVNITVTVQDETKTVTGKTCDSVMQILEKNGIAVPARCRSGECGFCHSHLISGEVYIPEQLDYRRMADKDFGCIHPCCTFPLTDLVINVPAVK